MWYFFHVIERQHLDLLKTEAACEFVSQLNALEKEHWHVWREGYSDWMKVSNCEELNKDHAVTPPTPPPPPTLLNKASPEPQKPQDRRKHSRVAIRLKVVVLTEDKRTFRSYTRDLSLGGLLLESPLPWPVPQQACDVFIAAPGELEAIQFRARILSDPTNPLRIAFEECEEAFLEKLGLWLDAMIQREISAA